MEKFLLTYRSTPHATIQVAPCTLFLGRSVRTRLDVLHPDISHNVEWNQALQKQYDSHAREHVFTPGDSVMVRNYRQGLAWIQGTLTKINVWDQ